MDDPKRQEEWQRALKTWGAENVRTAVANKTPLHGINRNFASEWLIAHDLKRIRWALRLARVRMGLGLVSAAAGVLLAIDLILSWLM